MKCKDLFLLTELIGQIGHCRVIENLMFEVLALWEHFQLKKITSDVKKCPKISMAFKI